MKDSVVFVAAKRTPFGAFGGSLKSLTATDLAVHAAKAALAGDAARAIDPAEINHVIFGNVLQTSADALYLARHVGLKAGVPVPVPALTVNRLCGSGFEAIVEGANLIRLGEARTVLVGGTESMSQAPYVLRGARFGYKMGNQEFEDSLTAGLFDPYAGMPMAITAENLAEQYNLSREACDEFALRSQQLAANSAAKLAEEIAPITISERGKEKIIAQDEHVRPEATKEALARLKPVFKKDGVVTAGNASGMVDGACAVVLTTREHAEEKGWTILGELLGSHVVGCDPKIMGIGPVPASRALLQRLGLAKDEITLVEVNEAFAAQTLAVEKELGFDRGRLNTEGGAIAIGHPLGATGARISAHLLYALRRRGGGVGLGTACIGGGQGIAVVIKV